MLVLQEGGGWEPGSREHAANSELSGSGVSSASGRSAGNEVFAAAEQKPDLGKSETMSRLKTTVSLEEMI